MLKKTALVTGSGARIGKGIAIRLAEDGFNVVVNGSKDEAACQSVVSEIEANGGSAYVCMADIGQRSDIDRLIDSTHKHFGPVHVLVNNAAIRPSAPFLDEDMAVWDKVMDVNFHSAVWLARGLLPDMIQANWGRIIHFTGMNAQKGYVGKTAVSVTKHALWGLTKSLCVEHGRDGVTCNMISPGTFPGDDVVVDSGSSFEQLRLGNPSGRLGKSRDIAGLVSYLCSDDGGFMSGQMLQVNGGVVTQV